MQNIDIMFFNEHIPIRVIVTKINLTGLKMITRIENKKKIQPDKQTNSHSVIETFIT